MRTMPQVIRALKRFCGALCIVVGAFVCLFAGVGFFIEADKHNYAPVIAVASVGVVLLACGARFELGHEVQAARKVNPNSAAISASRRSTSNQQTIEAEIRRLYIWRATPVAEAVWLCHESWCRDQGRNDKMDDERRHR
jgi:hypothetical protein